MWRYRLEIAHSVFSLLNVVWNTLIPALGSIQVRDSVHLPGSAEVDCKGEMIADFYLIQEGARKEGEKSSGL